MIDFANLLGQMNSCLSQWIVTNNKEIFYVQAFLYKILGHLLKLSYTKCYAITHTTNTLKNNISNV